MFTGMNIMVLLKIVTLNIETHFNIVVQVYFIEMGPLIGWNHDFGWNHDSVLWNQSIKAMCLNHE